MSNQEFDEAFQKLNSLFEGADDLIQNYNLLLIHLQKNPPKIPEKSDAWKEVKGLKPFWIS